MKKTAISITLHPDVLNAIRREAAIQQVSASAYINEVLAHHVITQDALRLKGALPVHHQEPPQ